ncbi:helix-turn-helix transcriptional regulator [Streptomyces sp. SL13]|uniref:Helix-turn-helix transcriptional regulator n=1 Tax=Streptantibioticus silvisoli TaxID=2705255 RepID=A0AA90H288_9ACTN|nr:helix-turn-helix transcriptional regulator [Streptantibioticus silvisoli]MDI5969991.1 helix-turn-helix transcriptional regulator [Streptantibioticus silvisoli]
MPEPAQDALGAFLRSRREQLTPQAAGVPDRRRRRTPGLRREEVAELAGIGVDWYVRLEQGRAVSPSPATIDSLARALRLDSTELAHLRTLAHGARPRPFAPESVPEAVRHLVTTLDRPAYVTGRRWDVLVWNEAAAELLIDFDRLPEQDRNILVHLFLDPRARQRFGPGWAEEAHRALARFRAAHDLSMPDPAFTELSARLCRESPEFATWWAQHRIADNGNGRKTLYHPVRGVLRFSYATFQANDHPALKLTVYSPL